MQKEIDELKKEQLSLRKNIRESIESNEQLILIVKKIEKGLSTFLDS